MSKLSRRPSRSFLLGPPLRWAVPLLSGVLLGLSCSEAEPCPSGTEGCACMADECAAGLRCLSDHCVDLDWTPPSDDDGDPSAGEPTDNASACAALLEQLECGGVDLSGSIDCSLYDSYPCDVVDYFDCLRDVFTCADGVPDVGGFTECTELSVCE